MAYLEGEHNRYMGAISGFDKFDPLLVSLHDNLKSFKKDRGNSDLYGNVEASIMNLMNAKLQNTEKTIVADIIIGIIKQARTDIKKNLAEKLAGYDNLHPSLLHYLAYEEIQVSEPILLGSKQLSDVDIMYIIQAKGQDHWRVIARRPYISANVISCLASKRDAETNIGLLDNETIKLTEGLLEQIAAVVENSDELADKLVQYTDLPKHIAVAIYWQVSNALRDEIVERFEVNSDEVNEALQDSMQDFTDTVLQAETMIPSRLMIEVAKTYDRDGRIEDEMLVDCLRRRQGRFFIALFAQRSKLSHNVIWTMMRQVGGQGMAVACRAMNISKKDFVSIFLLTGALARSKRPVVADELNMAIRYYEGLTLKMAQNILKDSIAQS